MRWMVFDVESVGLHGEGFAVGWVLIDDRGIEYASGHYACDPREARAESPESLAWVQKNCSHPVNCEGPLLVRTAFYENYRDYNGRDIPGRTCTLAADVPWPVEARFLAQVFDDYPERRGHAPYPLIDIASVRLAAGLNPLATCRRYPEEMPAHSPLADARQSARLLLEALNITNRGVVIG